MKVLNYFEGEARTSNSYEAPAIESVEVSVEQGFNASAGFDGPSYDEEDVIW